METNMRRWMNAGVQLGWMIDQEGKVVGFLSFFWRGTEVLITPTVTKGNGPIAGFELSM